MTNCSAISNSLLSFDIEKTATETIVRCTGKIVSNTCTLFREAIRNLLSPGKCIVVDLSKVSFFDSSGLSALAGLWTSAKEQSARVDICWESLAPRSGSDRKIVN
jgi:anti-anti-sigma factor